MRYITGGSGFIGSHLISKLEQVSAIPHDNIQSTKLEPFDQFYFLSSYGNLVSQEDEDQIYKANIEDLISVLSKVRKFKFKSFVFISTSSVMLRTQTTYSRTKRAAEEILLAFMERHDLPVCIIRPFSVTGVGEQSEHLIPTLIKSGVDKTLVNFVNDATHDFIDVEDVVDGIISLSQHGARGIFQLGTGKETTNQEVLNLVEKITTNKVNINLVHSLRPYDTQGWFSNNYRARSYGWLPKKTLEQSITEMVVVYKETHRV